MSTHNICFRQRGASNEYPQPMFSLKNKKNTDTFWLKKAPYQEICHNICFCAETRQIFICIHLFNILSYGSENCC